MSDSFYGEIKMFAGTFPPVHWSFCEGQTMPISQNQALYSLLGTTYGGDGYTSFGLPDMRSSCPMHRGNNFLLGQKYGSQYTTLTEQHIPAHKHDIHVNISTSSGDDDHVATPVSTHLSISETISNVDNNVYSSNLTTQVNLNSNSISNQGGNQQHNNMQPFLAINFIICIMGSVYPRRS